MAAPKFVEQLREQIGHEFAAHQQYVAIAAYYDALTMPRMAWSPRPSSSMAKQ